MTYTVVMHNFQRVGDVITAVSKKANGKIQANQTKYIVLSNAQGA